MMIERYNGHIMAGPCQQCGSNEKIWSRGIAGHGGNKEK